MARGQSRQAEHQIAGGQIPAQLSKDFAGETLDEIPLHGQTRQFLRHDQSEPGIAGRGGCLGSPSIHVMKVEAGAAKNAAGGEHRGEIRGSQQSVFP